MPALDPAIPAAVTPDEGADRSPRTLVVHALAHTHWDREWYHPLSRFRARLVALVDSLLAYPQPPFLLDGQTIVLADYLAIRPERWDEVARALATGAIEAGPWYVLADNLIPSGEAIVRNLEAGRRWLQRIGVTAPRVAYCPDTFGHPAALPTIAQEFGCDVAIVWRGYGGSSFPARDTAWWSGPDGRRVLLYHLPPDGYEFGSALPTDVNASRVRWRKIASTLRARNATEVVLLPVGADHHAPAPDLTHAIEQLDRAARTDRARVERTGLSDFATAISRAASAHADVPLVRGELRDSYGYTWTLQGTLGVRAHQKRDNARLERALLRDVEPWGALAWIHAPESAQLVANDAQITLAQIPALTAHAWETLLSTHPHDTLCGCSVDDVALAMSARQREVGAVLPELREQSLALATRHDRVAARARAVKDGAVVVRNASPYPRGGVVEVHLMQTITDIAVGPGSAKPMPLELHLPSAKPVLGDCDVQVLSTRIVHDRRESPQHYPDADLVMSHRALAWIAPVPALGVRVVGATEKARGNTYEPVTITRAGPSVTMSNGQLTLHVTRAGVSMVVGDRRIDDVLSIETTADLGDSYTASPSGDPERLQLTAIRAGLKGPLRGSVRCRWDWHRVVQHGATRVRERVRVWTKLMLDAGATHVRCDVRGWNGRNNHRLQLWWRSDVQQPQVLADAAFGSVVRAPIVAPQDAKLEEVPPSTMPLHRWLAVHNAARSAALISDGLAEGDTRIDETGCGALGVTLLRATGELSLPFLAERPGHAGWPCPIPLAQCLGRFDARVGLRLSGAITDETLPELDEASDALLLPLTGESWRDAERTSRTFAGPELSGAGLTMSTVRVSDDGRALVLRCVNLTAQATYGTWKMPPSTNPLERWIARTCRMDGEPTSDWTDARSKIRFEASPRAVVTLEVRRAIATETIT